MRRGFTLVELAIVLGLMAIVVPLAWKAQAKWEREVLLGHWQLAVADGLRTAGEELARDARRGHLLPGAALAFDHGACTVSYTLEGASLLRVPAAGCGPVRGVASGVEAVRRVEGGVELVFLRALEPGRAHRTTAFLPLPAPEAP